MKKALVAYFSCSGITKGMSELLASIVGGDLYEIKPLTSYTDDDLDWTNKQSRSSIEMANKTFRPKITGKCDNMNDYDVVFVGFPIWWYVAPTIINTFLETYDFSEKTIIPFASSGSSDVGETDKELRISCSEKTIWKPAKRFANNVTAQDFKEWVKSLKL